MRARVLTVCYLGAVLVLAGLLVAERTVVHQVFVHQEDDAHVINLAGRQRMLGQRLCALLLALEVDPGASARDRRAELSRTADVWERNQAALRAGGLGTGPGPGNPDVVRRLFAQIDADHRAVLAAARAAAAWPSGGLGIGGARTACAHHEAFLTGMDRIVTEYERGARGRIIGLRRRELVLLALALAVLALEGVLVLRPAVRGLRLHLAERQLVERALDASEAEKQAILRAVPDRLIVWSRRGGWAGLGADRTAGQPPRRLAEPVPDELAAACVERAEHALAAGAVSRFAVRAAHHDYDVRLAPFGEDRVLIAIRDVTELARVERQLLHVTDREQVRLAQDLHDGLGQHLIGIAFLLRPLRRQLAGGPAAAQLDEVDKLLAEAIDDTRDLVRSLHSPTLEGAGLAAALDELAANTTRVFGVACRFCDRAGRDLPAASRTHLYRIAREAVVNAAKHASATAIDLELACDAGEITLAVRDDGVGIGARPRGGVGLDLMAYRARILGASLQITAGSSRGTVVTCRVPLRGLAPTEADA